MVSIGNPKKFWPLKAIPKFIGFKQKIKLIIMQIIIKGTTMYESEVKKLNEEITITYVTKTTIK